MTSFGHTVKTVFRNTTAALSDQLGFPVALSKLEDPATSLTFLGIEIDSVKEELHLPQSKMSALKAWWVSFIDIWNGTNFFPHPHLAHLLRCLFFFEAHHQFEHFATHIPGAHNVAADSLSRNKLDEFFLTVGLLPSNTSLIQLLLDLQSPLAGTSCSIIVCPRNCL